MNAAARDAAAHRHTDAGPDRILCLLCGESYRAITYLHLRLIHGFESEHPIRDYKARFGLQFAWCDESREQLRTSKVARDRRKGCHWSEARIVEEIRARSRAGKGLARSDVPVRLSEAAVRVMGSWGAALRAAGEDPRRHQKIGLWDEARVIQEVKRFALERRASSKQVRERAPSLHYASVRWFGSWGGALRAAGLDPSEHVEADLWSEERAQAWIRERQRAGVPFGSRAASRGLVQYARRTKDMTWPQYVEWLGVTYPTRTYTSRWTDRAVLEAIRARASRGAALNAKAVAREAGQGLPKQARLRFGSWADALRRAGYNPDQIRKVRVWTRASVIAAIKGRALDGKSLRRVDVMADDGRLVKAAARVFPSSWTKAVAAAGLSGSRSGGRSGGRRRGPRKP